MVRIRRFRVDTQGGRADPTGMVGTSGDEAKAPAREALTCTKGTGGGHHHMTHICSWPGGKAPGDKRGLQEPWCCEKAVQVAYSCVCAYVTCCPEHGHWHFGSHE